MKTTGNFSELEIHIKPATADDLFPDTDEGVDVPASVGYYNSQMEALVRDAFPGAKIIGTDYKSAIYNNGDGRRDGPETLRQIGEQLYGLGAWYVHLPEEK